MGLDYYDNLAILIILITEALSNISVIFLAVVLN